MKQPEAESELSKQAIFRLKIHAVVSIRGWSKQWSYLQKNVYCNDGINKVYQHLDGTMEL